MTRIAAVFKTDLWIADHPLSHGPISRRVLRVVRVVVLAARTFWNDECPLRATALAYSTMLSIVPLMAVAFSLATAFPGLKDAYESAKEFMYQYLAAGANDSIFESLDEFVSNTHSGAIAGLGSTFLLVAVVLLLAAVETAFNKIWDVREHRRVIDRLMYYIAIVIIGPLLLGISLRTIVTSVASELAVYGLVEPRTLNLLQSIGVPLAASIAAFTVLYVVIPNTKVYWSSGLVGGAVAGVLFELAKRAYTIYSTRAIAYSAIYGTMGAIPIFIIWIYVIWFVILFGAELAYAWQNVDAHRRAEVHKDVSQSYREWLAAAVASRAVLTFKRGEPGPTTETIRDGFDVPATLVKDVVDRLVAGGILAQSGRGLLPARDPTTVSLADVVSILRAGNESEGRSRQSGDASVSALLADVESKTSEEYGKTTLDQLASTALDEDGESAPK